MTHYYCRICYLDSLHAGMFIKNGKPSSAYYGFLAFVQLYQLGNQAEIKNMRLHKDMYAASATGKDGQALLIANVSEKNRKRLNALYHF